MHTERKLVTVLFADVAGAKADSGERHPQDAPAGLTALPAQVEAIITAHAGTIQWRDGDGVGAIFGARQAQEEDAASAVRAALALQASLAEFQPGVSTSPLQLRIGIHTGMVALAPPGPAGERTATDDTMALACRLPGGAAAGSVVISHDTYRHVYGLFDVQSISPLIAQGKSEPVPAYRVLRARPRSLARTLRGVEGAETEIVGREREMERLQAAFRAALESRVPQVVTILGEAGIGKSRLLHEFEKWLEVLPQKVRLFFGRAAAEMTRLPFSLIRDAFCARFEIQESDPPALAREKFEGGLEDLLDGPAARAVGHPTGPGHFMGQVLGFDFSHEPDIAERLKDAEQIRHRAFQDFTRFFCAISREQAKGTPANLPSARAAMLVLEDVHWGDDGTLDLVHHLAQTCRDSPLLILALARPTLLERRPDWGKSWGAHERLELGPLSRRDSELLVQSILRKASDIPPAVRELILAGAGGNPFYIEEIIKMLIDQKVIVPDAEGWRIELRRLATTPIPPTLTGVLQARLDRLEPIERAVLQRASVVGHVFWDSSVKRLSGLGELPPGADSGEAAILDQKLSAALSGLARKELIFQRESCAFAGAVEYSFKHELLRNVAYDRLARKSRREYHALAAGWYIAHSGERIGEFTGLVATHFEQAGRLADAAEWYGRAGQQARLAYTPATATDSFRKALELLATEPGQLSGLLSKRLEWYEGLGDSLAAQAQFAEAFDPYGRMRDLAKAAGDPVAQARAWNGLAFLHERRGDNRSSVQATNQAETLARSAGDSGRRELLRALQLKGWAFYRLADAATVLSLGEQTLKLCAQFNDRPGMATSYKLHGVAHLQMGHYEEADRYFQQGLALCQELGDRRNAGAMWSNLGESARLRGDYHAAADFYQTALDIACEIGHRESEVIYLNNLAGARLGLGQFAQAEAGLRQAIALTGQPSSCSLSETYSFLAQACLGQGRASEAIEAARHGLALAQRSENYLDLGGAWRVLGEAAAALERGALNAECGVSDSARAIPHSALLTPPTADPSACFAESLRVFRTIGAPGEEARTLQAWAEYDQQHGLAEQSREKFQEAQGILGRLARPSPEHS
jgi:class 3 adenylate cyclase/tetratricopeptide (TPR) repeat protein